MDINIIIKNVLRVRLKNLIKDEVIQEIADEVEAQCIRKNKLPYNISSKELREHLRAFEELSKYYHGEKPKDIPLTEVRTYIRDLETEARTKRPQGEWIDYDNSFYKCPDCGYLLEKCCPQCQNKVILPTGGRQ